MPAATSRYAYVFYCCVTQWRVVVVLLLPSSTLFLFFCWPRNASYPQECRLTIFGAEKADGLWCGSFVFLDFVLVVVVVVVVVAAAVVDSLPVTVL